MWQNALVLTAEITSQRENDTIASLTQLQAEIYIPATSVRVWETFRQIDRWHLWYPDVLSAVWQRGEPWVAHSEMLIQVKNSLGQTMSSVATVQHSSIDRLVWENRGKGLTTRCTAWVHPDQGGSTFALHKSYTGPTAWLMILLKARQKALLEQGLANLANVVIA